MGKQIVIHILSQLDDILAMLARSYSRLFKVLCHFPVGGNSFLVVMYQSGMDPRIGGDDTVC